MKKMLAIFLTGLMLLSLFGCSSTPSEQASGDPEAEATPEEPIDAVADTTWISLNGTRIRLNADGTMSFSGLDGKWSREDDLITITYANASGNIIERKINVVEKDGTTILRSQKVGTYDGASSNFPVADFYSEKDFDSLRTSVIKQFGDTVSTDLADFTLEKAEFCYYASGLSSNFCVPLEKSDGSIYVADTGKVFVWMTFTITNKNRSSLDIGGSFADWPLAFYAIYGDDRYSIRGFDLNSSDGTYGLNLGHSAFSSDGGKTFEKHSTGNELLSSGETVTIRVVGIVNMDPSNLSDAFDLAVSLPTSSGEDEWFLYAVK